MAVEVNAINDTDIYTEGKYSKSHKFLFNFGNTKYSKDNVMDKKLIKDRSKAELDVDTQQIINQSLLDYTTQPITPMF